MVVTGLVWALEIKEGPTRTQPLNPQIKSIAPAPSDKKVFVTSQLYKANFGGLAAADAICQATARGAGLGGTYKAWLSTGRRVTGAAASDTTISPATRFTQFQGPYKTLNGLTIATNWSALVSGTIANPINIDERGNQIAKTGTVWCQWDAWTGTEFDGKGVRATVGNCTGSWTTGCANCADWTIDAQDQYGLIGNTFSRGWDWTGIPDYQGSYLTCNDSAHFYCFEQ